MLALSDEAVSLQIVLSWVLGGVQTPSWPVLGLMAAIFYLLTAATAIWCYRHQITSSAKDFVIGGLMPGLGAAFMAFVVVYSVATGSLNAVELTFGIGLALAGLVLSVISARVGRAPFYTDGAAAAIPEAHR